MSVVVRMEIPNGCHDCKLRNMVGNCQIPMFYGQDEKNIWTLAECFQRPPWCPIICSIPEGHGRLVDADALYKKRYIVEPGDILAPITVVDACYISGAPTIVPAEAQRKVDAPDAVTPTDTPTDTPTVPAERSET